MEENGEAIHVDDTGPYLGSSSTRVRGGLRPIALAAIAMLACVGAADAGESRKQVLMLSEFRSDTPTNAGRDAI